ncbi:MAG TPA: hypothetical protein ENG87_05530 [Candidatus Pacearchaeota archaeon]|nr:hypothetical protein [Candidatus Pacearchaeota archaeon]HDZ61363.1 hypothetical protein [Candidatus Pacearchaeota archaeon]
MRKTIISPSIEVVAFDVYGVILATTDEKAPRKGIIRLLDEGTWEGLTFCTCSDALTEDVLSGLNKADINPRYFDNFFKMPRKGANFNKQPKDFLPILKYYNLLKEPNKLLVIGDRKERDINPALKLGCQAIHVPMYYKRSSNIDINNYVKFLQK